jgi:hypothetical protein
MQRWDPCTPGFVLTVLRATIGLWLCMSAVALVINHSLFWGVLSGGFIALGALGIVIQMGRHLSPTARYAGIMLGLLGLHLLLWVVMALLLAVVKVSLLGFLFGAAVLPAGILLSLSWYLFQQHRMLS